jgi:hypothetical protein
MMSMHILHMYNSMNPCKWDESLPYVYASFNRALQRYIGHNPFQVCLGFYPLDPIDVALPLPASRKESSHT